MQLSLPLDELPILLIVRHRLQAIMGPVPELLFLNPMSQLVFAMLSKRTRDETAGRVFQRLQWRYPSWQRFLNAAEDDIRKIIWPVTDWQDKLREIRRMLTLVKAQRGSFDLTFLAGWRVEQAIAWLRRFDGVGPEVAATVMNFSSIHARCLPVDRHLLRVGYRMRLTPSPKDYDRGFDCYERLIPDSWGAHDLDALQYYLKRHSREICTRANPACNRCVLANLCPRVGLPS